MSKILSSEETYLDWRLKRIIRIRERFPEIFDVKDKKCLDIGCGELAPLSSYLSTKGAHVYGGEITEKGVKSAKNSAPKSEMSLFTAEALPFKDETFDIVYLWDILEHVNNVPLTIKDAKRVCKKDGLVFMEFSPYWAYPTGAHLYNLGFPRGYLPFQLLPASWTEKIVLSAKLRIKDKHEFLFWQFQNPRYTPEFLFWQFKNLKKLRVSNVKNIMHAENLSLLKDFYFISLPNNEIKINLISKIPILRDILTMNYSSVWRK